MAETSNQLKRIQEKLQKLTAQFHVIRKENSRLKEELESSRAEVAGFQEHIDSLKQQVSVLRMNAGEMSMDDKKEFEKKLNLYIKEIDRCIAMLGE